MGYVLAAALFMYILKMRYGKDFNEKFLNRHPENGAFHQRLDQYLSPRRYYKNLSLQGQIKFRKRLIDFMGSKSFQGLNGCKVTEEMKVLISASAVQLTYGLKEYILKHYHTIKISPEAFYSRQVDGYMKGGASVGGVIFLSWKDFEEGYANNEDKFNLGLHEMAHALKLDVIKGQNFDARFANYLDNWEEIGSAEFAKMRGGSPSFLRAYAGTNMHEFFAVCVEHFFEVPEGFKANLPDLYYHMSYLLNQDPLNVVQDYQLKDTFVAEINSNKLFHPIPRQLKRNLKYASWHWTLTMMLLGIFVAPFLIMVFGALTVIKAETIFFMLVAIGVGGLFQWIYFRDKGLFLFPQFVCYCFFGFGSCITGTILLFNFIIPLNQHVETYRITDYSVKQLHERAYVLELEGGAYWDHEDVRTIAYGQNAERIRNAKQVNITFSTGLFGLKVRGDYELK